MPSAPGWPGSLNRVSTGGYAVFGLRPPREPLGGLDACAVEGPRSCRWAWFAWGGTVMLWQPGDWPTRFDRQWLPGCLSVTVPGVRSVVWGPFTGSQRISMQVSARIFLRPLELCLGRALCGLFCRYRDPWADAVVPAGRVRTTSKPRARARAREVERASPPGGALVLQHGVLAAAGSPATSRGIRCRGKPWPC